MENKDSITIYWAPSRFTSESSQWNMLYSEPKAVSDNLVTDITENSLMVRCPATRNILKNVFSIHSNVDDDIDLASLNLSRIADNKELGTYALTTGSKVDLFRERPSSYEGYVNIGYNLGWMFFADEPVNARWMPPYFPTVTPTPNSIFTIGKYDIGQWFRPTNIDYHVPIEAEKFTVKTGDPLAFLEIETEKAVRFQRFTMTQEINQLSQEFTDSPTNYGQRKTLAQRYQMSKRAGMPALVLSSIRKNLV
jgi:hypothetical protein